MDSIKIGWKKQSPGEVQFLPSRQFFQQTSTEKINNEGKKVRFNCQTPNANRQAFENTEEDHVVTNQSKKVIFEGLNYTSSAIENILNDSENYNESICSVRAVAITFIIAVLVIIAAGIAVGIVFGTVGSSKNTNTAGTENANRSTFSTILVTAVTTSVSIGNQSGLPCSSYTTINDPTRNVAYVGSYMCDDGQIFNSSNGHAWIRFDGSGGTIIPLSSPGRGHCGSYVVGWFNGTLPTIFGSTVNGSICFDTDIGDCFTSRETSVTYCIGSFYVYFLQPVNFCNVRYCTI